MTVGTTLARKTGIVSAAKKLIGLHLDPNIHSACLRNIATVTTQIQPWTHLHAGIN